MSAYDAPGGSGGRIIAWGDVTGTTGALSNASGNVAGVTRLATGVYEVELASPILPGAGVGPPAFANNNGASIRHAPRLTRQSTTVFRVEWWNVTTHTDTDTDFRFHVYQQ